MARAQGARAQMALAFETTYGTLPMSGYTKMPFASTTLGAEQPLQTSELLGYGRDPQHRRDRARRRYLLIPLAGAGPNWMAQLQRLRLPPLHKAMMEVARWPALSA